MQRFAVVLLLVGASLLEGQANAQVAPPPFPLDPLLGPCATTADLSRKRPIKALLCSVVFTGVPAGAGLLITAMVVESDLSFIAPAGILLFWFGVLVGPSAGHVYAGDLRRAYRGAAWRVGGSGVASVALVVISFYALANLSFADPAEYWSGWDVLLGVGLGVVAGSTVWDLATAPLSAAQYNRSLKADVRLRPVVDPVQRNAGLSLTVRF